jgi:hypothetical protein
MPAIPTSCLAGKRFFTCLLLALPLLSGLRLPAGHFNNSAPPIYRNIDDPDGLFRERDSAMHVWLKSLDSKSRDDSLINIYDKTGTLEMARREVKHITDCIDSIKSSEVKFRFLLDPTLSGAIPHGFTSIEPGTEVILVRFDTNSKGKEVVIHEIIHCYQYLQGKLSIRRLPKFENGSPAIDAFGTLYDITDENEAYRLARIVADFTTIRQKWNRDSTVRQKPEAYAGLPREDLNIYSRKARVMFEQTYQEGAGNVIASELYKGWEDKYRQGCKHRIDSLGTESVPIGSPCQIALAKLAPKS